MDAVSILRQEIDRYLSANTIFDTYKTEWQYLLESYLGGLEYRKAQHLTRYQLETDAEYDARIRTTPLQNHCSSVVSVYNSFLFRTPPTRKFGDSLYGEDVESFLRDADFEGRSLDAFMKDVATWSSVFGHCWVIVAKPNVGAVNRAQEIAQGVRPYVSLLTPMTVLDWNWSRQPNGRYELDYLKYIEEVNGDVTVLKLWSKDAIETVVINTNNRTLDNREVVPNGLGRIPAVIAYNRRGPIRGIGVSDIADIADNQKFIYNATSEIDQSIRLDSHPSLVKTSETISGIGAGSLIHMPENLDPGLKPYILEFSGAAVDKILESINHTIEAIDKMANIGAVRATQSRTMSGVAMETEFQLLNARLAEKADNLELAEEHIWELWYQYQNSIWMGDVEYPGSFNIRDAASGLEQLLKASTAMVNSKTFSKEVQKQIAKLIVEDDNTLNEISNEIDTAAQGVIAMAMDEPEEEEEGFEVHIMLDPNTGEMVIAKTEAEHEELAAKGWVHI
jgi:hypothetical protein